MTGIKLVQEPKPINISHETYQRECRYTKGIHIPEEDLRDILDRMSEETRIYFEFHNPEKTITKGTYLNGHAGLANSIYHYYEKQGMDLKFICGQDFYVKII